MREYLPREVVDLLDPEIAPEAIEGSFVDADAARTQCDALFRVRLRTGHDARIYVLLEHKSYIDAATPLQILKYLVNIWLREIERGTVRERLPPIIPLVFYHGSRRWTVPRSVVEMVDAPDELQPLLRDFAYVLYDLGEIEPLRLSRAPEVLAGLLALRVAHADEIPADLLDLMTGGTLAGSDFERHLMRYIVEIMNLTPRLLEASLRRTKPDRWEALMGTVAEAWLEQGRSEGRAEGVAEGIEKGQAGIVLRLMELRFGVLADAVRDRVRGASAPELEAWAERVLTAASIDEVLAEGSGNRSLG